MQIKRTQTILAGRHRVSRATLGDCLRRLGVTSNLRFKDREGNWVTGLLPQAKRNDLYYVAELIERAGYIARTLLIKHHPDKGGNTEKCQEVNELWQRILKLAKQKQIPLKDDLK